jgi:hypothetical protein
VPRCDLAPVRSLRNLGNRDLRTFMSFQTNLPGVTAIPNFWPWEHQFGSWRGLTNLNGYYSCSVGGECGMSVYDSRDLRP